MPASTGMVTRCRRRSYLIDQVVPAKSVIGVRDSQTVAGSEQRVTTPRTGDIRIVEPGAIIWLTGLSGAGKTTLAIHTESRLRSVGYAVSRLDGDELRSTISADLGFSDRRPA